jgi:hypothetical protein
MDWFSWLKILAPVLAVVAQAVIEGSRAAGVTHDTVALTVAKTVKHLLNGKPAGAAETPAAPPGGP